MLFEVTAVFPGVGVSYLQVNAESEEKIGGLPELKNGIVISVRAAKASGRQQRAKFPLPLFTRQLLSLLEAGLTVVEGLETLVAQDRASAMSAVVSGLLVSLREGQSLSVSMQSYPEAFPELYVATVKASERTGDMPEALRRYIVFYERIAVLKKKIISAAIYPLLLMSFGTLVTLFLLGYVVPRFSLVFADSGRSPEGLSSLIFSLGGFINSHGLMLGVFALALGGSIAFALMQISVRARLARLAWFLPGLGERIKLVYLARFYRTVGMLLRAGIPLKGALEMVMNVLPAVLRPALSTTLLGIEQGLPFSRSAESSGLTTPVALRMIAVGEKSGQLGPMMESVAAFYDDEINDLVDTFTRLFEPLLMAVIGGVIGGVVLLLYMPIFELAGNFQ